MSYLDGRSLKNRELVHFLDRQLTLTMSTDVYAQLDHHCRGYARVELDDIEFDSGRDLDDHNVERLIKVFELVGCKREHPANAISVMVEKEVLANMLTQQLLYSSSLHSLVPTQLQCLNTKVTCLHGRHRICAARKFLQPSDRWWTVKLFDSGRDSNIVEERELTDLCRPPAPRSRTYSI